MICFSHLQMFNYDKSLMFFSDKIPKRQVDAIKDIFQLKVVSKREKYFGLLFMVGKKKKRLFPWNELWIISKISKWQHKFFSNGGNEMLIKAMAQAIPAYTMSVFRIPVGLCDDIQRTLTRFWWDSKKDRTCIHWAR